MTRVTGRLNAFSPGSVKIHADIDPSSINKVVQVDVGIVGDATAILDALIAELKAEGILPPMPKPCQAGGEQINQWRSRDCLRNLSVRPRDQTSECDQTPT